MNSKILSGFLWVSLALTPAWSQAEGLLCSRVFLGTGISGKLQEYKTLKQGRQMIRAIKNGNRALEEWTAQYYLSQLGPRISLKDYIFLSKAQRQEKLFSRMIQERFASGGLLSLESTLVMRTTLSQKDKAFRTLFEWSRSPVGQVLRLPLDLPVLKDRALDKATAQKWILEGLDKHRSDVEQFLQKQSYVEGYKHFRSTWQKGALAVLFVLTYNEVNDRYDAYESQVKEKVKDALEDQLDNAEMDGVLIAYAEKAFETMLAKFRAKYGEPTPEEYQEMRILAYKEYGLALP